MKDFNHIFVRLKSEQTLQAILLKFDNDVGSKSLELETLLKESKIEFKTFEKWQDTLVKQQKVV